MYSGVLLQRIWIQQNSCYKERNSGTQDFFTKHVCQNKILIITKFYLCSPRLHCIYFTTYKYTSSYNNILIILLLQLYKYLMLLQQYLHAFNNVMKIYAVYLYIPKSFLMLKQFLQVGSQETRQLFKHQLKFSYLSQFKYPVRKTRFEIQRRQFVKLTSYFFMPPSVFRSQQSLVQYLVSEGFVKSERAIDALKNVDRANYTNFNIFQPEYVYADHPLPLKMTGETISAPHMHAKALQLLSKHAVPGARVLDVGSGSGYLTACFGKMVEPDGKVIGIEKHKTLVSFSESNIKRGNEDLLNNGIVEVIHGNVLSDILVDMEPFDAIHVGAAAETLPQILVNKLKNGGMMVIPVGPRYGAQYLDVVNKNTDGEIEQFSVACVRYVPLTKP
eukprot:TRINITY_DN3756_c0_g1_i5.p1 TRINITY_DN3756_c0_g1~~TRINITY_DN3756_c0_g1_i5.p1  ORF type:complete len:388 (-),score=18.31 TRINITY_DN3756_c0_g1_i5:536-1699(-)